MRWSYLNWRNNLRYTSDNIFGVAPVRPQPPEASPHRSPVIMPRISPDDFRAAEQREERTVTAGIREKKTFGGIVHDHQGIC